MRKGLELLNHLLDTYIDDQNYDIQLNGYKKYIETLTNKRCKCYLYSIINEKYREINYE